VILTTILTTTQPFTCVIFLWCTGSAIGLVGCIPCDDGYFASPSTNITKCQKCEAGFYASQSKHTSCTHYTTDTETGAQYLPCLSGAVSCEQCPSDTPNTNGQGSTSINDCRKCGNEQYAVNPMDNCVACSPKCGAFEYESVQCTQTTNRRCRTCFQTDCGQHAGNPG